MELLKKKIKIKDIYLILVIVLGLITISLYSTYALFTGSVVSSNNIANVSTDINIDFDINSNKTFTLDPGTIVYFNANVKNNMTGSIYYELYHNLDLASHPKITIGEVVADPKVITKAPNTSGTLEADSRKTVPLIIENNSSDIVTVNIGLAVGYVGEKIEYGTLNYPSGVTLITGVYDDDKVPSESCASSGPSIGEDCTVSYELKEIDGVMKTIQNISCPVELDNSDLSGASVPALKEGMIPVKWDSNNNLVKADVTNPADNIWYSYSAQKWANAVMVTENSRSSYVDASVGTTISEGDILAYFVWIPRYKYKLFNVNSNATIVAQTIEITFQDAGDQKEKGSTNGTYLTHPAFSYQDTDGKTVELNGFWAGKFETNGDKTTPTIKPGIPSLRQIPLSYMYEASQQMNSTNYLNITTSSRVDAHMMKNTEWGAIAYLSHSIYGKNSEVDVNTNSYNSGGGGGNSYLNNIGQSTTGNVYGIYDMSGATWEYVMGNYNNSGGISGLAISSVPNKYKDIYNLTNLTLTAGRKLGDATGETKGWYSDISSDLSSQYPWIQRGGQYDWGASSGLFTYGNNDGNGSPNITFRISLW